MLLACTQPTPDTGNSPVLDRPEHSEGLPSGGDACSNAEDSATRGLSGPRYHSTGLVVAPYQDTPSSLVSTLDAAVVGEIEIVSPQELKPSSSPSS